jgi:6,7-dimethyl-8-ribityllumazine synthase
MTKEIKGYLDAAPFRFAIVAARFNELISHKLIGAAIDCIERHNGKPEAVTTYWVPGIFRDSSDRESHCQKGRF